MYFLRILQNLHKLVENFVNNVNGVVVGIGYQQYYKQFLLLNLAGTIKQAPLKEKILDQWCFFSLHILKPDIQLPDGIHPILAL